MSLKQLHRAFVTALCALAALLALAAPAAARTVPVYTYTGDYYDGTGSTAGTLAFPFDVASNQANGKVYVTDPARMGGSVSQFDVDGDPLPFPALEGATSIDTEVEGAGSVAVDNSSTASQGNIYVLAQNIIKGYNPDGTEIGGGGFPIGGFQYPCGLAVDVEGDIWGVDLWVNRMTEYDSSGAATGRAITIPPVSSGNQNGSCDLAIDSNDNFYLQAGGPEGGYGKKFDPDGDYLYDFTGGSLWALPQSVDVDLSTNHVFTLLPNLFGTPDFNTEVFEFDEDGEAITAFGAPDPAHSFPGLQATFGTPLGLAVSEGAQRIYVGNYREYENGVKHIEIFAATGQAVVPTVKTEPPELAPTEVTLRGSVDLDGGGDATTCQFEWGTTFNYGQTAPCEPGPPISGPGVHEVSAELTGLTQGTEYHYRLVAKNGNGILAFGRDHAFRPQGPASISAAVVSDVNTDGVRFTVQIDPNGGETSYQVEYGPEDCDLSACASAPTPAAVLPKTLGVQPASILLAGLEPGVSYHYRIVVRNEFGEVIGAEDVFRTYAPESTADDCPNALVRKETGGVLLPDCRAYELVSPSSAGGYDVTSDLVPGQVPFTAKPRAKDRVLYSLHFGKVPGVAGEPTNYGMDPYVATRTASGWSTAYAGIAVGDPPYQDPFGSTPLDESENLSTFAFGGSDICDPCFDDGGTGIPIRRNGGPLTQGMAGSIDPGPGAVGDGYIGRRLSPDGTHLIFGSTSVFESDAADDGDVSIYDRNLVTGVTNVVSKTPAGANLPCLQGAGNCHGPANSHGIGALDVSEDGSRIVVANRVSTDSAGNHYWHPYMNIGASTSTVDLAPGTTSGVLYAGMTSSGSAVFYTTEDPLTPDDNDSSPDLYRANVDQNGGVTVTRVSIGAGAGDTDACDPAPAVGNNWNMVGGSSANGCGTVAFAGGAGVARAGGAIFFLSPEKLDGASGVPNQPNLYVASPGGSPKHVGIIEPSSTAITNAVYETEKQSFEDIQVTPDGNFAVFSSSIDLTGYPTFGHSALYRYSLQGNVLDCASCAITRASLTADTRLSPHGLGLTDDGRVLFTSVESLVLRDTASGPDVYEWSNGRISLISTGRSATDSGLLSVSADGANAYFFTRDTLVSGDHNGKTVKIYVARENGGFPAAIPVSDCQASDECHGPGSAAPPTAWLPTFQGTGGNVAEAPRKKKKKHRKRRRRHRNKKHQRRGKDHRQTHRIGRNG